MSLRSVSIDNMILSLRMVSNKYMFKYKPIDPICGNLLDYRSYDCSHDLYDYSEDQYYCNLSILSKNESEKSKNISLERRSKYV